MIAPASEDAGQPALPSFVGAQSCSSTSCHGGAGNNKEQYTIWTKYDFHHARPYATLETARAERLAQVLKVDAAAQSTTCTICHAPFHTVPTGHLAASVQVAEGVSCESCHGPAHNWLRGHTRHDWTQAERVQAGMRDLKNLYVRANVCVACHQNLSAAIEAAGHPELVFELDGQAVSQPRHWPTNNEKPSPQVWLVGQAVALREMSWQLAREKDSHPKLVVRWAALVWLLQLASRADNQLPALEGSSMTPTPERLDEVRLWSDQLAKQAADLSWTEGATRKCIALLAQTAGAFNEQSTAADMQGRRAERLVLALDRLLLGFGATIVSPALNDILDRLFEDVQSLPDFAPKQFAKDLQQFHASATGILTSR